MSAVDVNRIHATIPSVGINLAFRIQDICEWAAIRVKVTFDLPNYFPIRIHQINVPSTLSTTVPTFLT